MNYNYKPTLRRLLLSYLVSLIAILGIVYQIKFNLPAVMSEMSSMMIENIVVCGALLFFALLGPSLHLKFINYNVISFTKYDIIISSIKTNKNIHINKANFKQVLELAPYGNECIEIVLINKSYRYYAYCFETQEVFESFKKEVISMIPHYLKV